METVVFFVANIAANFQYIVICVKKRDVGTAKLLKSKEILLNGGDEISKNYVAHFIVDYFGMSGTTAEFFNLKISDIVREKYNFILLH